MNIFDLGDIKVNAPKLASLISSNPNKYTCEVYKDITKTDSEALLITLIVEKMERKGGVVYDVSTYGQSIGLASEKL